MSDYNDDGYGYFQHPPVFKFAIREELANCGVSFLPKRATDRAAAWDVRAAIKEAGKQLIIKPNEYVKIPLGFRAFPPDGWWYELKPRSSTFGKKSLHCLYGTIDEDFEGELLFAAQYLPEKGYAYVETLLTPNNLVIEFGEAIGQIIPVRRQDMVVEEISNAEYDRLCKERNATRGAEGFGTTGK
jgi:dUTPase